MNQPVNYDVGGQVIIWSNLRLQLDENAHFFSLLDLGPAPSREASSDSKFDLVKSEPESEPGANSFSLFFSLLPISFINYRLTWLF